MSVLKKYLRKGLGSINRITKFTEWLFSDNNPEFKAEFDRFGSGEIYFEKPKTIIDVGGSHGQFAIEAFKQYPGVTIHSFEPLPECYQELVDLANVWPDLNPVNLGLSDVSGVKDFWVSKFNDSSSLQEMLPAHIEAWPFTATERKISINVTTLDSYIENINLVPPVMMKIDVQGHETHVIQGAVNTLKNCQRVIIECNIAPLYKDQPSFTEINNIMKSLGFCLDCYISPLRHPKTREIMSFDLIYFRPEFGIGIDV